MNMQYSKYQTLVYLDSFSDYDDLTVCYFLDRFRFAVDDYTATHHAHSEKLGMSVIEDITTNFLERQ